MMVFSLQLVNRPEAVDSIYRQIEMDKADLTKCVYCIERFKIRALAHIEMGEYQEAIELLRQPAKLNFEAVWILKQILIRAHIRAGDFSAAEELLEAQIAPGDQPRLLPDTHLFAAKDFLREGDTSRAFRLLEKAIASYRALDETYISAALRNYRLGEALFFRQSYKEALPYLKQGYVSDSLDFNFGALYAISLQKSGQEEQARALLKAMEALKADFQFGELYYSLAQYYAATQQPEACMENLLKAISEGHWYETGGFRNDPLLRDFYDLPGFRKAMTYWQ